MARCRVCRGEGTSVDLRLGKVEASERSEDFDAGLRVFVGQRNASISTSQLDSDNIKSLAQRAVAMAKLRPTTPMHASPTVLSWPNNFPNWKCMMNTFQRWMI